MLLGPLLTTILLGPLVVAAEPVPELTSPARPGRYTLKIQAGGYERVAQVHIPPGYQSSSPPPLVLMLHGAGGTGASALEKDGWRAKADKEGFIAVAPEGLPVRPALSGAFFMNPQLWNSGQLKAGSARAAVDDVAYIRQLLDALHERAAYDKSRVYCAGHSNGGGMTLRLAAELPERFAAVGAVAGVLVLSDPQPPKALPTLCILGTQDPLLPLAGGEVKLPWGSRQNPPVAEPLAKWAQAIGCQAAPQTVSETGGVKEVVYPSQTGGPQLTVLYLEGHGHHWPGGERTLPESMVGPITSRLNATDVLWEFFQRGTVTAAKTKPGT